MLVQVDVVPCLEAVGFGGNAAPLGMRMCFALVGLTVRSGTRDGRPASFVLKLSWSVVLSV